MCGIAGIFAYTTSAPPADPQRLARMSERVSHRGPDAAGTWVAPDGRIGLAHRRLAVIDLSANASQPMALAEGDLHITYNGEIYNYKSLRDELTALGCKFRTASDTEVILHGYVAWGAAVVDRLRGMFAFAIWDGHKRGLFLARDPFGIKPLYYTDSGGTFQFASEVKAFGSVAGPLSAAGQVSFLTWGFVREPFTIRRDVRALTAGSTLWVDEHGPRSVARYWSEVAVLREAAQRRPTMDLHTELAPALRAAVSDAVIDSLRHHYVADVPVGLFLSGGLDSATLLALAATENVGAIKTLTIGFDRLRGTPADETPYAETLARSYSAEHHTAWVSAADFTASAEKILQDMDQPTVDAINVYFTCRAATALGFKVALSGLGGDELFAGYPAFRQIPMLVSMMRPLVGLGRLRTAIRKVSAPVLKHLTSPKYAGVFEYGTTVEDAYLLRRGLFLPWELPALLPLDVVREGWNELTAATPLTNATDGLDDMRTKIAALEMSIYMRNQLLRDSDWASMAHGLELRTPLVDRTLFTALAPLLSGPSQLSKADLSGAPRHPLPGDILNRPKTGFTVPVRDWVMAGAGPGIASSERGLRGWARLVLKHFQNAPHSRAEPPPSPQR